MKLWKKILIGVLVIAVIGIGAVVYGLFKVQKLYTANCQAKCNTFEK